MKENKIQNTHQVISRANETSYSNNLCPIDKKVIFTSFIQQVKIIKIRDLSSQDNSVVNGIDWYHGGRGFKSRQVKSSSWAFLGLNY